MPYPARRQVRPVSFLAELLGPFAGGAAEQVAADLIAHFGTMGRMLSASDAEIMSACQGWADVGGMIAGARALVLASLHESISRAPVDISDPNLAKYLALIFRGCQHEQLHAIFVDRHNGFISIEHIASGQPDRVEASISSILRRAMQLEAAGFYLAHNHPSNSPHPSAEDVQATRRISAVAAALEIKLIDHLIVAGTRLVSMREAKLL